MPFATFWTKRVVAMFRATSSTAPRNFPRWRTTAFTTTSQLSGRGTSSTTSLSLWTMTPIAYGTTFTDRATVSNWATITISDRTARK